jgi:hypothetical protein
MPTGDNCLKCLRGHIYPTGEVEHRSGEDHPITKDGREQEWREYKCDNCGQLVRELTVRDRGKGTEGLELNRPDSI